MERNFETVMIEQCAPVLASLKPAGLFRYETSDCADLARRVRSWNEQLGEKGLCVRVLKGCVQTHRYLVYVYRESKLRAVLAQPQVRDSCARKATLCLSSRTTTRRFCSSCPAGSAARPIFPMKSAYFWAIRSTMWWALSKMRAATSPAAAAGKPMVTPMPPSGILLS